MVGQLTEQLGKVEEAIERHILQHQQRLMQSMGESSCWIMAVFVRTDGRGPCARECNKGFQIVLTRNDQFHPGLPGDLGELKENCDVLTIRSKELRRSVNNLNNEVRAGIYIYIDRQTDRPDRPDGHGNVEISESVQLTFEPHASHSCWSRTRARSYARTNSGASTRPTTC